MTLLHKVFILLLYFYTMRTLTPETAVRVVLEDITADTQKSKAFSSIVAAVGIPLILKQE